MVKISVIIPVYNSEKYLPACLDSVLQQTLQDIEVLAVNNGCTDGCAEVLSKYAQIDSRVRVLTLAENDGVSLARNLAMEQACGKYIVFCDSDDIVPVNAYYEMYRCAEINNADIVVGNYVEVFEDHSNKVKNVSNSCNIAFKDYMRSGAVWNRLFRREFIIDRALFFQAYNHGEDTLFIAQAYAQTPVIAGINTLVYCYVIRNSAEQLSLAHDRTKNAFGEYLQVEEKIAYLLRGYLSDHDLQKYVCDKTVYLRDYWWKMYSITDKAECFDMLKQYNRCCCDVLNDEQFKRIWRVFKSDFASISFSEYLILIDPFDIKELMINEFADGYVGFRYIGKYMKAWWEFKLGRGKDGK